MLLRHAALPLTQITHVQDIYWEDPKGKVVALRLNNLGPNGNTVKKCWTQIDFHGNTLTECYNQIYTDGNTVR